MFVFYIYIYIYSVSHFSCKTVILESYNLPAYETPSDFIYLQIESLINIYSNNLSYSISPLQYVKPSLAIAPALPREENCHPSTLKGT